MFLYVMRRIGSSILMMVIVSIVIFVVLRLLPGDPTTTRLGQADGLASDAIDKMRASLGLDQPIAIQYVSWIGGVVRGDFGTSYFSGYPVSTLLAQRLPATLELASAALVIGIIIAVVFAVTPLRLHSRAAGRVVEGFTVFGLSAPPFVIGILMILAFATGLGIAPTSGYVDPAQDLGMNLRYLALPAITLGIVVAAPLIRYLQSSLDDVRWATFVRTARGKGIGWPSTLYRHVLPNALLPALTSLGITVGALLGGSVVVETVFAWPGVGQAVVDAVLKRDYAVVQCIVLFAAACFVATSLVVDLLYGVLDPRLRAAHSTSGTRRSPKKAAVVKEAQA